MTWTRPTKHLSTFINGVKQFLKSYLLWNDGDEEGYLLYTDDEGGEGKILLEDHSFQNLPKHPSLFTNQVKH